MSTWVDKFYKNFERAFKGKQLTRFVDGDGYSVLDVYTGSFKRQMGLGSDSAQLPFFKFFFDAHDDASDYTPLKINVSMTTKVMEGQVTRYMLADHSVRGIRPISITSNDNFRAYILYRPIHQRRTVNLFLALLIPLYDLFIANRWRIRHTPHDFSEVRITVWCCLLPCQVLLDQLHIVNILLSNAIVL